MTPEQRKYSDGLPSDPERSMSALTKREIWDLASRLREKARKSRRRLEVLEPQAAAATELVGLLKEMRELKEAVCKRDELIDSLRYLIDEITTRDEDNGPLWVAAELSIMRHRAEPDAAEGLWESLDEDRKHVAATLLRIITEELDAVR